MNDTTNKGFYDRAQARTLKYLLPKISIMEKQGKKYCSDIMVFEGHDPWHTGDTLELRFSELCLIRVKL